MSQRQDDRTYVRLHDGFPEHPKVAGLSDKAVRTYIEALCYCSRNLTDGRVPLAISKKLAPLRVWRELMASCLVEVPEEGADGYALHDYLEHQRSADQVRQYKEAKRVAGSKGGRAKAAAVAAASDSLQQTGKQTPSKIYPETETETETEVLTTYAPRAPRSAPPEPKAHRLPDDWEPSEADIAYALERGIEERLIPDLAENFRSHWLNKPGKDGRKIDWSRAWQTWVRNEEKWTKTSNGHGNPRAAVSARQHTFADGTPMPWDR